MPNNPYSDVLGAQSKRYRRGGESRFGNVDRSRLEPLQDVMSTATQGIIGGQQKELERQRTALEQAYINRGLQRLNTLFSSPRAADNFEVNKALDDVTIEMLRHGGTRARQTASDIQKLRRKENTDTSLTPEKAYLRGKIPFTEYEKIKRAGKAEKTPQQKSQYLRSEKVTHEGRTKLFDIYGYKDDRGQEVITNRKPTDFTKPRPSGLGGSAGKESLLQRLYDQFTNVESQIKDLQANFYRGKKLTEVFPDKSEEELKIWKEQEMRRLTGDLQGKSKSINRLEKELGITSSGEGEHTGEGYSWEFED